MKLLAATAAMALGLTASSAFAAEIINITATAGNNIPAGSTLITDFNSTDGVNIDDLAPGFTFTQDANAFIRQGSLGLDPGVSAPPPGDTGYYETVGAGGSATLTSAIGLRQFSIYMGSPDTFNHLTLTFAGAGGSQTLTGPQIWCQDPSSPSCYPGAGDQSLGYTITYTFAPDAVNTITFSSSSNAFEFDTLAGIAVPEPGTWALMIMGFGGAGALLRQRRRVAAVAA